MAIVCTDPSSHTYRLCATRCCGFKLKEELKERLAVLAARVGNLGEGKKYLKHNISEIQKCGAYREKTRVLVEDRSRRRNKQKIGHEEGEGTGRGEV